MRRHTVPATSRFNVDVKASLPELQGEDAAFGALIEVTNSVPIAVERSLYWNANGVFWAGGATLSARPCRSAAPVMARTLTSATSVKRARRSLL